MQVTVSKWTNADTGIDVLHRVIGLLLLIPSLTCLLLF